MLAMLEKLINEHGSSSILRERLELFSDKYSMLEEKNTHLSERNKDLESQAASLKEEVEKLKSIIDEIGNNQNNNNLPEVTHDILKFLFDQQNDANTGYIGNHFSLDIGVTEYHIDKLKDLGLIEHGALFVNQPLTYRISKEGRKYIVEK